MFFSEEEISAITSFLSQERLATFEQITGGKEEAISLHQQMLQFGTTLMSVVAIIEIATRNAVCEKITAQLRCSDWLRNPPATFNWENSEKDKIKKAVSSAQKAAYSKLSSKDKKSLDTVAYPGGVPSTESHEQRSKKRQKQISIPDGQLITQLTMFFWKRLFSDDYEHKLWERSLKYIFPNKSIQRSHVAKHFEEIYQARNRIAHHEPIYDLRLDRVMDAINFVLQNFGSPDKNGLTPLKKLLTLEFQQLVVEAEKLKIRIGIFRSRK